MKNLRYLLRLLLLGLSLLRHGILFAVLLRRPPASGKLARALEEMGPSFIKLGQTLSTRPDLVGVVLADELSQLRDSVPPFSSHIARRILTEEFGKPTEQLFATFNDAAVAAASVAQVHRAMTHDGREVAVKIIRPRVARAFARDIALFYWIARHFERFFPTAKRLKLTEVVRVLESSVAFELDLRFEAAAITEMQKNTKDDLFFRVPTVDWNLTAGRVLTTEWIDALPIHDAAALTHAGHDVNLLMQRLSAHFFRHVFRDGFFHADMHPGNVLVDAQGNIVFIDFGIMGRLHWRERIYVAEIFRGFLSEDYRHVAELHFRAGYVPAHHSVERFAQALMAISKPVLNKPLHEISLGRLLAQLFMVTEAFDMETQPQLLLLQRNMVLIEGIGGMLNPALNMWELAREPIEDWARSHLGVQGRVRHTAMEAADTLQRLPEIMKNAERVLKGIADHGGIRLSPSSLATLIAERRRQWRQTLFILTAAVVLLTWATLR